MHLVAMGNSKGISKKVKNRENRRNEVSELPNYYMLGGDNHDVYSTHRNMEKNVLS